MPRCEPALNERLRRMPELRDSFHPTGRPFGCGERGIMALVNEQGFAEF